MKYKNQPVSYGDYHFSSKLEAAVYQILEFRLKAGEIQSIQPQFQFHITRARIGYKTDFLCRKPDGSEFAVEAKGVDGERWRVIKNLWKYYGPMPLEIWKGKHNGPKLVERIFPIYLSPEEFHSQSDQKG